MIARFSRMLPLLVVLAVVALIIYLVAMYLYSPNRAKEILIKVFTWLTGILSGFFLLASLYAWFEHNEAVLDLVGSCLVVALLGLAVARICRAVFVHHHPDWARKPLKAKRIDDHPHKPFRPPWQR